MWKPTCTINGNIFWIPKIRFAFRSIYKHNNYHSLTNFCYTSEMLKLLEANNKKIITRSEYSPREAKNRKRGNGVLFHITQGEQITKKYEPRKKNKGKEKGERGRGKHWKTPCPVRLWSYVLNKRISWTVQSHNKNKRITSKYSSQAALCFIVEALKPSTKQITHSWAFKWEISKESHCAWKLWRLPCSITAWF